MVSNIVTAWKNRAKQKSKNMTEAVKFLNVVCMTKITLSTLNEIEKGQRKLPETVQRYMINEVLLTELDNAGFNCMQGDFEQLRDALSLPQRIR